MKIKEQLQGYKTIKINGIKFVIRKLNPLLDFRMDKMPQIFTDFLGKANIKNDDKVKHPASIERLKDDMYAVINAGVIEPEIVPVGINEKKGKEEGITVEDIFRDIEIGFKLYTEIIAHSLNRFKGLRGLFFYLRIKRILYIFLRSNIIADLRILFSQENQQV